MSSNKYKNLFSKIDKKIQQTQIPIKIFSINKHLEKKALFLD